MCLDAPQKANKMNTLHKETEIYHDAIRGTLVASLTSDRQNG